MSHQAVTWAMKKAPMLLTEKGKPDTTARHVLAVLAECAEADGSDARPSLMTVQYRSGYDRRTVQRALRRLEDGSLIRAEGAKFGCTVYRLAMHLVRPESDWAELEAEEARQKDADAERQRRSRARRVTHAESVTVTDAECVTGPDVKDAEDVSHALSVPTSRTQNPDVTDGTPPNTSFDSSRHSSSLSSQSSQPAGEEPHAAQDERETEAAPDKPTAAQRAVRSSGAVSADEEQAFITWCTAKFNVKHAGWWKTCADDLPEHAAVWRGERAGFGAPRSRQLPDWCRVCGEDNPAAEFNPNFRRTVSGAKCPDCHPDVAAAA